jgi:hypothetical protein
MPPASMIAPVRGAPAAEPARRMLTLFVAGRSVVEDGMARDSGGGALDWTRRLTPLAWLFVVLAGLDLAQRLLWLPASSELTNGIAAVTGAIARALLVLLPAAVLVGDPAAWRERRLVIGGALAICGAELVSLAVQVYRSAILAPDAPSSERVAGEVLGDLLRFALVVAWLAGVAALGAGLARRYRGRAAGPTWRPAPATLVIIALGAATAIIELLQVLGDHGPVHRLDVVAGAVASLVVVAWAYVAAVTLPDGATVAEDRRARTLLASAALLFVAASALGIVNAGVLDEIVGLPTGFFILSPLLSVAGAILFVLGLAVRARVADAAPAEAA